MKKSLLLLILFFFGSQLYAQTYNMGNSNISTCSGTFLDGPGNYANTVQDTMTFCSSTSGQCVKMTFTAFDLETNWDFLYIYNGPTATGTPIATLTGTAIPAPVTATSGCLTFVFSSDFSVTRPGWSATVNCVPCPGSNCTTCSGGPAPANDACAGAQNLGALPLPPACVGTTGGTGAWASFNTTNVCATAEVPYTSLLGCQPAGNMASPAADVWYRFTITGPILNIQVQGLQTPNIGLYQGTNCNNMIPRGCAIGAANNLNTTFSALAPGTYYLQVSGGTPVDQCAFTLALQNNNDCVGCLIGSNLTVNPPPVNGTYQAGQTVNFCYTITDFNQTSANWLHGVVPTFGPGWNLATLNPVPSPTCSDTGYWQWYGGTITSSATGAVVGPGFFFNTPAGDLGGYPDTNPGDNFGDVGNATCDWTFCWSISTLPQATCVDGASLNVGINTYGDGESGSWTSLACNGDPVQTFFGTLTCCVPPLISVTNPNCAGNNGSAIGSGQGNAPWDYIWKNSAGTVLQQVNNVNGTNSIAGLPAGTYTLTTLDNTNCSATTSFTIAAPPAIIPANIVVNTACGQSNGSITVNASGGISPYTYSNNNGATYQAGNVFNNLAAGNYTIVVRDFHNCIASIPVVVATSAGPIINTTPVVAITCNGASTGTITINATGGVAPLTYSSNGVVFQAGNALTGLPVGGYSVVVKDANGCTSTANVVLNQAPPIVISAVATVSATCGTANGSLTITAAGGTGVLQYSINNGTTYQASNVFNGLAANNYDVVVRDANGCTVIATPVINNTAAPVINNINSVNVTCNAGNNGSIVITASGGTGALQFSINNGTTFQATGTFNGLTAGSYDFVVKDASGCEANMNVVITAPPAVVVNATPTGTTCGSANGSIAFNSSGGTAPLTYSINNGVSYQAGSTFTNLASGNYNVVVRDVNGCTATATVNIPNAAGPSITTTPKINATCFGANDGAITVNSTGGTAPLQFSSNNGTTYQAANVFTGLIAGNYQILILDANGCTASANVNIAQPTLLVGNGIAVSTTCSNSNGSITASAAGGVGPYQYSINGGTTFQASGLFNGLAAMGYGIIVTDANGCVDNINVNVTDNPSPRLDSIVDVPLSCSGTNNASLTFYVSGGTAPIQYSINNGTTYQNNSTFLNLSAGTFNIIVRDANGCSVSTSFVIAPVIPLAITSTPIVNPLCAGSNTGSITINASGGTPAYQYSINNGGTYQASNVFNALAPGNYQVVVRDVNGCTVGAVAVNIAAPAAVVITSTPATQVSCNGAATGSITINANGGTAPLQYSINNGVTFQNGNVFNSLSVNNYQIVVQDANGCSQSATVNITQPPALVITSTPSVNLVCNGVSAGSITINANGGTAPLQYSINNGTTYQNGNVFNNLAAGNYQIIVQDANSCTQSSNVSITQPPAININSVPTVNVLCNGATTGSITINANGGTAPLQYSINNGTTYFNTINFGSLGAGTYQVVVRDANGCTQTTTVVIAEPLAVTITTTPVVNVLCNGQSTGSITINANGGTAPLLYSINGGSTFQAANVFSNLTANTYQVVVGDVNGCTQTTSVTITQPSAILIPSTISTNIPCSGGTSGSITINANGGVAPLQYSINNGTTYQLSNSFINLTANTYQIVVQDANGCTRTNTVTISEPTQIVINSTPIVNVLCNGASTGSITINASGGVAPLQYSINNGTSYLAVNTYNNLAAGNYQVVVRDANGCTLATNVGITQPAPVVITLVNPTPVTCNGTATGSIIINANGGIAPLQYSINNGTTFQNSNTFNNVSANNYQIVVQDANGCTQSANVAVTQPTPVVINSTPSVNVLCNSAATGSITINANGGTAPLQYSINNGSNYQNGNVFNNLTSANYQIVVQDANGCTQTAAVSITQPTPVAITSVPSVPVVCNGDATGSITINANGGTAPLQYSINNGTSFQNGNAFNNLAANTYQIIVQDANGCTQSTTATVTQPTAVIITTAPATPAACSGTSTGSIIINANGGTVPLQYSINNGSTFQNGNTFNNLAANNYQIVVQDANGCTQSATVVVSQPTPVVIVSAPAVNVLCNGATTGSITVNANGGTAPLQYSNNNGTTFQNGSTFNNLAANNYQIIVQDANGCTQTTSVTITQPSAVIITSVPTAPATCNGTATGGITVNANGGVSPIQYSINNGVSYQTGNAFSNLNAGNYIVVVQDANGCTQTANVTVSQPTPVVITSVPTVNVLCNGASTGSVTINANGGTAPLQYSIDNGSTFQNGNVFNALAAGNYQIVVQDANGCTQSATTTLTQPASISFTTVVTDANCGNNNGTIVITATGGATPFTYSINNGLTYQASSTFNALLANNYSIVIQDANGCTFAGNASVSNLAAPAITNVVSIDVNCNGNNTGGVTITASGGTGALQYSINNGATFQPNGIYNNLTAGTYSIVVRDAAGCQVTSSVTINEPPVLSFTSSQINTTCGNVNGQITINASGGTPAYQYSFNNGATYQAGNILNGAASGNYTVIVRDVNGCTTSSAISVTNAPSPAINAVPVVNSTCNGSDNGTITINTTSGTAPLQFSINNGVVFQAGNIFSNLTPGNYQILVQDANGCTASTSATVTEPTLITGSATTVSSTCGNSDGSLTVNANGGTGALQYSINNGVTYQAGTTFSNLLAGTYTIVIRDANGCTQSLPVSVNNLSAPSITSANGTNATCNGVNNGSIIITANGGTGALQYSINNGTTFQAGNTFNGLAPGNYSIVVKDANGCNATANVVITQPPAITGSANVIGTTCSASNGSVTITANSGTGVLQYSINNGTTYQSSSTFNNISAGNYTVMVQDANGCTTSVNAVVTDAPSPLISSTTTVNNTCNGSDDASITINANGGTAPLQYSINGGTTLQNGSTFTSLSPGNYSILVQDANGCTATSNVILTEPAIINATVNTTPSTCGNSDGSFVVNASGGTGAYQYSLNNGTTYQASSTFSNLLAGNYTVIVKDANGCTQSFPVAVSNQAAPSISSASGTNATCNTADNGSIQITAGGGTGTLQYSIDNGTTYQSGSTFNNLAPGSYAIVVTDANGCNATSTVVITEPPAITGTLTLTGTTCSNANGNIVVNANGGTGALQYSINNGTTYQASATFNTLAAGNYTVIVQDVNSCTFTLSGTLVDAPSPTITALTIVNSTCNNADNGSVTVTASGGTAPLSYSISGGPYQSASIFNNLGPGNYAITVQDANGCTVANNAPVSEPTAIVINATTISSTCGNSDGSINVNANGGTGALQYSINNGTTWQNSAFFNALAAGNYNVIVRDVNGCTQTAAIIVSNQAAPSISSAVVVDLTCNSSANGNITVNASGGTGALQYSINNGITFQSGNIFNNLTAGNYAVVVQDANGCNAATNVIIMEPAVLTASVAINGTTCSASNGNISVTANGGTIAYQYSINNGVSYQASSIFNTLSSGNYTIIVRDANGCTTSVVANVIDAPAPVILNTPVQNITCNGLNNGSITINSNGGTNPVSYSIDNGASYQLSNIYNNLTPGNYAIVVQDANGCSVTTNANITQPVAIIANGVTVNANCNQADGSLTINANGGSGVLQYSIDNGVSYQLSSGFNFLNAGNYTVIVKDANGCTTSVALVINNNSAPSVTSAIVTDITCNGLNNGTISITANGGSAPLQYSINNGLTYQASSVFNSVAPGNYSVVVIDASGCTAVSAAIITQPTVLAVNAVAVGSTCGQANGSLQLNASGGTIAYQYSINNGSTYQPSSVFNNITSGAYTIVVQDANGCTVSINSNIPGAPSPLINSVGTANLSCAGSNDGSIVIAVNGGTAPIQYSVNGGTIFQSSNTFQSLTAGNYNIVVQDANGCSVTSNTAITQPSAINATAITSNANCNQADGSLTVNAAGGSGILQYSIDNGSTFQLSNVFSFLTAGNYSIIVQDANGCQTTVSTTIANNSAPVISSVVSGDVICNGAGNGSIVITAANGSAPLSYSINNGSTYQLSSTFNNLLPGNYAIVVQDPSGCTVTDVAAITEPLVINVSSVTTIATCGNNNGGIVLNATGGTSPLQYSINNGSTLQVSNSFSNLSPANYQIVVQDANGCTMNAVAVVGSAASPLLNAISVANISCNGAGNGSISISGSGGTAPLTYSINNGLAFQSSNIFSNLSTGNYTIVVKDANGCTVSGNAVITQPAPISVAFTSVAANCGNNDGSVTINANGGAGSLQYSINGGSSYQSGNVFPNLLTGNYVVVVQDLNGCTASLNANVPSASAPVIVSSPVVNATCNGSLNGSVQINVNGGTAPYDYSINGGITTQIASLFNGLPAGNYSLVVTDVNGCSSTGTAIITEPTAITVNVATTSANCGNNDGSITVNAIGGAGGLQYSINNGLTYQAGSVFNNIGAGNYNVVVKDVNGCTALSIAAVNNNNAPVINSTIFSDVTCNGGSNGTISVVASSVIGAVQYSINSGPWQASGNFSGLSAGNYSISVRDINGCLVNTSFTLVEPAPLLFNTVAVSSTCGNSNGALTINAIGGTAPYQYSIDNGVTFQALNTFNNLPATNYSVVVMDDNGCTSSLPAQIINAGSPAVTAVASTDAVCNGSNNGSITVSANGGSGTLQYSLNNGTTWQTGNIFNNLSPNNYTVLVQDANGCTTSATANVNQPSAITVSAVTVGSTCNALNGVITVTANGGTGALQYSADNGITYQSSASFNNVLAGNYSIVVQDANGCTASVATSVGNAAPPTITLTNVLNVSCNGAGNGEVTITAIGGTSPLQYSLNAGTLQLSNQFIGLAPGNYSIVVQDANGCTATSTALITQPQQINYIVNTTTATCGNSNGSLTISGVTGGNGTYQYSINNGTTLQASGQFLNLPAATYSVFVQDGNGCAASSPASVVNAFAPSVVSVSVADVLCNGGSTGSLTVTPAGVGPFQYSINNGVTYQPGSTFNNLSAATYTVIVKDVNGCTASDTASILNPNLLTVSSSVTGTTCSNSNGTVTLTGNGGTGSYSYSISNGVTYQPSSIFNNLSSGNYNVIIRDVNGCTAAQNVVVNDAPAPLISTVVITDVTCFNAGNGTLQVSVTGGTSPLQYSANNGSTYQSSALFTNLANGNYSILITDSNGCSATSNAVIAQPSAINYNVTILPSTCGNSNGTITVNNVSGGNGVYTFSFDNGVTFNADSQLTSVSSANYNVVVSDGNGCSMNAVAAVNNLSGPSLASVTLNDVLCFNGNSGSIQLAPNGGTGPFQYSSDNGTTFQSGNLFSNLLAGTYTVVIKDANGCLADSVVTINQPAQLILSTSSSIAVCGNANGSITLTANGGSGSNQFSINNGITYQTSGLFSNLNPGTYQSVVTDVNGCIDTTTIVVNAAPSPTLALSSTTDVSCYGLYDGEINVTATGGTSPIQYSITPGSAVWQSSNSFANLPVGSYTITVSDSNGCADSVSATLVQPQPVLLQAVSTAVNCYNGNDGTVNVIVNGGSAPYTYLWSNTDTSQSSVNLTSGIYIVTVSDQNNCSQSDTVTVNQPLPFNAAVTLNDISCNGMNDGSVSVVISGGSAPYYYIWSGSLSTGPSATALLAGNYILTVTDAHNCTYSDTYTIVEPDAMQAALLTDSVKCNSGSSGAIEVINAIGGVQPYTYLWSNNETSAVNNNVVAGLYSVTITDNHGCTIQLSDYIYEPAVLQALATGSNILCNGQATGSASVNANGGTLPYSYLWSTGGFTSQQIANLTNGIYSVTVTDGNGCKKTVAVTLTQPSPLSLRVSSDPVICDGQSATVIAGAYGGTAPYQYFWNTGYASSSYAVTPDTSTTYSVYAIDNNGCVVPAQNVTVFVNPELFALVSIGDTICKGEAAVVTCTASGGNGGPYTYTWTNNSSGTPQITVHPDSTTTYQVTITDGCTVVPAFASTTVNVNELPNLQFTPNPGEGCVPLTVAFQNGSNNSVQYIWHFGDGSQSVQGTPTHTYTMSGVYDVSLEATSSDGCKEILLIPDAVTVHELPVAEFNYSPYPADILNMSIEFSNHSLGGLTYFWDFGDGAGTSNAIHPEYLYSDSGTYNVMLVATSQFGCLDTTYGEVIINGVVTLYVPNSFTPNDDGRNDFFTYYGEGIVSANLQIFNRWGDVVYKDASKAFAKWDGRAQNGEECQQGVYVYLIKAKDINGTDHEVTGTVTLVR